MKLGDLTELASQNLREALLRNSLTTVGIAVGVASLVAMLSLGVGLQELINRRLESNGLFNTVSVRPQTSFNANGQMQRNRDSGGRPIGNGDRNASGARNSDIVTKPLDVTTRQQLAQLPHVIDVYPEFRFTGDLRFGPAGHSTPITSLPISAAGSDSLDDIQGHFFSSPNAHEVILQTDVAADLADSQHLQPAEMLGKDLVLRYAGREPLTPPAGSGARDRNAGRTNDQAKTGMPPPMTSSRLSVISSRVSLRVVGIVATEAVASGASAFRRPGAYVPVAVAEELGVVQGNDMGEVIRESTLGEGGRHYSNLTVRVERPADVPAVEDAVRQMGYSPFPCSISPATSAACLPFWICCWASSVAWPWPSLPWELSTRW